MKPITEMIKRIQKLKFLVIELIGAIVEYPLFDVDFCSLIGSVALHQNKKVIIAVHGGEDYNKMLIVEQKCSFGPFSDEETQVLYVLIHSFTLYLDDLFVNMKKFVNVNMKNHHVLIQKGKFPAQIPYILHSHWPRRSFLDNE